MRIRTQFILTMLLFGIILVVIAVSAIITNQQVEKTSEQEKIASSITQGASELGCLSNDYLIYRESQQLKRWQSRFASFSSEVASLHADRPDQQALVSNIQANQKRLKEVFDSVVSAVGSSSQTQSVTLNLAFLQVSWSRMAVQSQGLVSDASRLAQLLRAQENQLKRTNMIVIFAMIGVFGAYFLINYLMIQRRTLRSIAALQAGTAVIGSGNLDYIIEEKKNDEIGDLSRAFNQMTANLKAVTASKADLEREIAERKKAEEDLREAHERAVWLSRFPEENPNPVLRVSVDGSVLYCNPAAVELPGWECQVGQPVHNLILPLVGRAMVQGKEAQEDVQIDGRFYFVCASPFPGESYANIYGRDITERKQAEETIRQRSLELEQLTETLGQRVQERTAELEKANEALRHLSSRLLSAHEEERKRIAGDLHDTIGACLTGIKYKVENAMQQIAKTPGAATESLKTILPVIQEGVEECRRIQMDLRPPTLDDLGLLPTLSWFCRRFQTIYSAIRIELEIDIGEDELPNALKIVIYRVTQEAMNNIAKHGKADLVRLSLQKIDEMMELVLEDNGQGFDVDKVLSAESTRRGLGLSSMRERVELSGGSFAIESAEGKGTTVRASWLLHGNG